MKPALRRVRAAARPVDQAASQARLEAVRDAEHPRCLLCGASNPHGLGLKFTVQADGSVLAIFPCRDSLQSYGERLHGGLIAAVLDAAMTNALFSTGVVAATAELTVRFLAPVTLEKSAVARAWIDRVTSHHLYYVCSELQQDQEVKARASAKFVAGRGI